MALYTSIADMVGETPLLELKKFSAARGLRARIFAKLERFNPAGSVKDRVAASMIADAEERGALKAGSVIIEPTSGNTGIGLAALARAKGYRVILTMPDSAFYGCASLTYAALPLTLPEISRFAFAGCAKLNRVDIPPMVNEIKRGAFSGCFNLISADLPGALRTIGASAFNSCNSLTEVRVPQSVTQIGPGAFAHCKKLHTLAVPKSLRNIGRDAVKGTAVTKITRL